MVFPINSSVRFSFYLVKESSLFVRQDLSYVIFNSSRSMIFATIDFLNFAFGQLRALPQKMTSELTL